MTCFALPACQLCAALTQLLICHHGRGRGRVLGLGRLAVRRPFRGRLGGRVGGHALRQRKRRRHSAGRWKLAVARRPGAGGRAQLAEAVREKADGAVAVGTVLAELGAVARWVQPALKHAMRKLARVAPDAEALQMQAARRWGYESGQDPAATIMSSRSRDLHARPRASSLQAGTQPLA